MRRKFGGRGIVGGWYRLFVYFSRVGFATPPFQGGVRGGLPSYAIPDSFKKTISIFVEDVLFGTLIIVFNNFDRFPVVCCCGTNLMFIINYISTSPLISLPFLSRSSVSLSI